MGLQKNNIYGELPKRGGGLGQFTNLRNGGGGLSEKEEGGDTPMHTMLPLLQP